MVSHAEETEGGDQERSSKELILLSEHQKLAY